MAGNLLEEERMSMLGVVEDRAQKDRLAVGVDRQADWDFEAGCMIFMKDGEVVKSERTN
jgi:hypothetical protein